MFTLYQRAPLHREHTLSGSFILLEQNRERFAYYIFYLGTASVYS